MHIFYRIKKLKLLCRNKLINTFEEKDGEKRYVVLQNVTCFKFFY